MTNSMVLIGGEKQNLSRVMYVYKESGDDADLKGLSWEKYLMLKGKDIIDEYIPPQPMDEETL
ncbi:hypothetical protein KKG05_06190 [bacterium]|nr:hypothetical protein [bacterium]